jgi:hypothetical protein
MAKSADECVTSLESHGNDLVAVFSAVFMDLSRYPVPRHYFLSEKDLLVIGRIYGAIRKTGKQLKPFEAGRHSRTGDLNRVRDDFERRKMEAIPAPIRRLIDGRRLFTSVDQTFVITSNFCLCCGRPDFVIVTTTIGMTDSVFIVYSLCPSCLYEAQDGKSSLWEFVCGKLGVTPLGKVESGSLQDLFPEICAVLERDLGCKEVHIEESRNTIKAKRPTGFELIFRLDSREDYAYMIKNPNGKEVARFDSADHHIVDGGPHHLHFDLGSRKAEKIICPSYFIGCPLFDLPGFKALVELKERQHLGVSA